MLHTALNVVKKQKKTNTMPLILIAVVLYSIYLVYFAKDKEE